MNLTGTWKGEYAYEETDEGAGANLVGEIVTFTMELKQGWFGAVSGTIKEDPRVGFAEEGTIKGKLKGKVFVFEKAMPVLRMMHETGRITLDQWAQRRKVVMDTNEPHPKIRHIGDISEDGNTIEGTWLMKEHSLSVPGSYEQVRLPTLAGTWKMTRA